MPRQRTDVEKIREVLRLSLELKFSIRKTAEALEISKTSVGEYIAEFKRSGLTYRDVLQMEDKDIVEIFEKGNRSSSPLYEALSKEFPQYQRELSRVGVTLYLLWEEYKSKHPDGFSYSRFCHYYRMWESKLNPSMHIEHKAGDLIYADFTGKKMHYYDIETGEIHEAEVFISVLGASQLIYVEALDSQKLADWIWVNENSWWYYGGVTNGICPDNLKSAVTKACNYEPLLNETYHDLARHYNTVILPTRPIKPKDKSLVEHPFRQYYPYDFPDGYRWTTIVNTIIFSQIPLQTIPVYPLSQLVELMFFIDELDQWYLVDIQLWSLVSFSYILQGFYPISQ